MNTEIMKLEDICPAAYNPRVELKEDDGEYEALKNSLTRFGVAIPLIVNKTTGNLVSGHQRLNVLKAMGETETEVVVIELNEDKEKLLNIALNKIDGEWDVEKLGVLFADFADEDIKFTGYSTEELDALFGKADVDEPAFSYENDTEVDKSGDELKEKKEKPEKEFNIFFSFPTKEAAENWLKKRGQDTEFEGTSHNVTIRMEGVDFGTRD